jgi:hypothetical protein
MNVALWLRVVSVAGMAFQEQTDFVSLVVKKREFLGMTRFHVTQN